MALVGMEIKLHFLEYFNKIYLMIQNRGLCILERQLFLFISEWLFVLSLIKSIYTLAQSVKLKRCKAKDMVGCLCTCK